MYEERRTVMLSFVCPRCGTHSNDECCFCGAMTVRKDYQQNLPMNIPVRIRPDPKRPEPWRPYIRGEPF